MWAHRERCASAGCPSDGRVRCQVGDCFRQIDGLTFASPETRPRRPASPLGAVRSGCCPAAQPESANRRAPLAVAAHGGAAALFVRLSALIRLPWTFTFRYRGRSATAKSLACFYHITDTSAFAVPFLSPCLRTWVLHRRAKVLRNWLMVLTGVNVLTGVPLLTWIASNLNEFMIKAAWIIPARHTAVLQVLASLA